MDRPLVFEVSSPMIRLFKWADHTPCNRDCFWDLRPGTYLYCKYIHLRVSRQLLEIFMILHVIPSGTTWLFTRWNMNSLLSSFIMASIYMSTTWSQSSLKAKVHLVTISFIQYAEMFLWDMYKFRSIAALQPNPRRLTRQKYYQKNAARMIAQNSVRYRNQAVAQREIPDGLASPAPSLPPVPKAQRKAEKERETKAKADVKSRAKKVLPKPRFYIPYQKGKVGNESQRHKRSGSDPRNKG